MNLRTLFRQWPAVLVGLALVACTSLPAQPATSQAPSSGASPSTIQALVSLVQDVVNILFFLIIGAVGILSYLQARKTLFTPMKTETFKYQLKLFEDVLLFVQTDYEADTGAKFDMQRILGLNAQDVCETYAKHFFGDKLKMNEAQREARTKQLVGALVKEQHLRLITDPVAANGTQQQDESSQHPTNPAVVLGQWQKYDMPGIGYTAEFVKQTQRLRQLKASPVMPTRLRELIEGYERAVSQNLMAVGEVLTESAREFPDKYPTPQALAKADFSWIWNRYNSKREKLDEPTEEIRRYVSEYLRVDQVGA